MAESERGEGSSSPSAKPQAGLYRSLRVDFATAETGVSGFYSRYTAAGYLNQMPNLIIRDEYWSGGFILPGHSLRTWYGARNENTDLSGFVQRKPKFY